MMDPLHHVPTIPKLGKTDSAVQAQVPTMYVLNPHSFQYLVQAIQDLALITQAIALDGQGTIPIVVDLEILALNL